MVLMFLLLTLGMHACKRQAHRKITLCVALNLELKMSGRLLSFGEPSMEASLLERTSGTTSAHACAILALPHALVLTLMHE